jgi:ABC-type molybdenum transport system ATPase subunit/photorepair protein PhrA/predicted phosphodiesterase
MGNILVISDVHINDYAHRNPSYRYRLLQSRIVAQNIIKVAKANGVDTLFIAGDLIHKSVMRPYILAEVKLFLDVLMKYFKTGRIIYGNHDLDSKLPNQDASDCVLSVMLPQNMKYVDRSVEKIGKSTFAFSNWRQGSIDLSWIPGHVDFLITHATIAYNPGDYYQSTTMDESKFDFCITGDIHRPDRIGKYVSIGIPQRCTIGDSTECTGVIIDPYGKVWKHINLNPDDNLLKFEYIKDQRLEGYHAANNTWYIYQPDKSLIPGASVVSTQLWAEVDGLIDGIIQKENLQAVHAEVLRRLPTDLDNLDLGFVITGFRCKNWRSIDNLDMKLGPGDRVILHGQNGSGKSSVLSALKYAFLECPRGLKNFVCNKTDDPNCWTEVDFLYQGHQYTLRRGTGTDKSEKCWGLWIDGVQQPYQNLTSFNSDVAARFPFLEVFEYFYFDDTHARFLGDLKNEEKPMLISKLLKLNKINIYNETAIGILDEIKKSNEVYSFKTIDLEGRLNRLSQQKLSLHVPNRSIEELRALQAEGFEIQKKATAWINYQMKASERLSRIELLDLEVQKINSELSNLGDPETLCQGMKQIETDLIKAREVESKIQNMSGQLRDLQNSLNQVNSEGSKVWAEYQGLKQDICPTCGQVIDSDLYNQYKKGLETRLIDLQTKQQQLQSEINSLQFNQEDLNQAKDEIKRLEGIMNESIARKTKIEDLMSRKANSEAELAKIRSESSVNGEIPEKVVMPENAFQIMSSIESDISAWTRIEDLNKEIAQTELELKTAKAEISKTDNAVSELTKYIGVTGPVGEIYTEVLNRVATEFSDNHVHYVASKFTFRKKDHLDLVSYYINPDGKKIVYDSASSGQKTMMDLHIMSKLTEGLGLVVFDEFLKSLDPGNHDEMLGMIKDMKVGTILLVSHQEGISGFQNKTMELSLGSDGFTKIQFL